MFAFGATCYWTLLAMVLRHALGGKRDSDIIYKHPTDLTVVEGEPARFHCRIKNLELKHIVQWRINGFAYGPWREGYREGSYAYPEDGDISLDVYDLVVDPASWREHDGSTFSCQVPQARTRSRTATLTVLVPPSRLNVSPTPTDGLIVAESQFANVSCGTNHASPGTKIGWLIDGNQSDKMHNVSEESEPNPNGARLEQVESTIKLPKKRMNKRVKLSHLTPESAKEDSINVLEKRRYLEGLYENVYHLTCQVSNPLFADNVTEKNIWVVFQSLSSPVGHMASVYLWVLVGLACFLFFVAVLVIAWVFVRRSEVDEQHSIPKRTNDVVTFITDQGVCSSTASDRHSDVSSLRPQGCEGNMHMLHGQANVATEDLNTDPFGCGDSAFVSGKPIFKNSYNKSSPGSVISSTQSTHASDMRYQMLRFLDLQTAPPPRDFKSGNEARCTDNTYSLPRYNIRRNLGARAPENSRLTTFESLPRYGREHPLWARFSNASCDPDESLPLPPPPSPPEDRCDDLRNDVSDLPPPMFVFDDYMHNACYNQPGWPDGEGMSDPSPNSNPSCKFIREDNLSGSLV